MSSSLSYIHTKPGIFKSITVAVGLLAMIFVTVVAYDRGAYYHIIDKKHQASFESYCKGRTDSSSLKTCPFGWLVMVGMASIAVVWVVSAILLVVMFYVDINHKFKIFTKIDAILQFMFGGVFLGSALFLSIFLLMIYLGDFPCTGEKVLAKFCPTFDPSSYNSPSSRSGQQQARGGNIPFPTTDDYCKDCAGATNWQFQNIFLSVGIGFAIPAGILYVVSGLIVKRYPTVTLEAPANLESHSTHQQNNTTTPAVPSEPVEDSQQQEEANEKPPASSS